MQWGAASYPNHPFSRDGSFHSPSPHYHYPPTPHFPPPPYGNGRRPIRSQMTESSSSSYPGFTGRFSLPPMKKVSETLGALGTLARHFIRKSSGIADEKVGSSSSPKQPEDEILEDGQSPVASASTKSEQTSSNPSPALGLSSHMFTIHPEKDEELRRALYTLGNNVLGEVSKVDLKQF